LLSAPNVVLTPHLAGATRKTSDRAAAIVADEVERFLTGKACRFVVNPEVQKGLVP
jgi:D-3-phosphoglycerate dehydrogenase